MPHGRHSSTAVVGEGGQVRWCNGATVQRCARHLGHLALALHLYLAQQDLVPMRGVPRPPRHARARRVCRMSRTRRAPSPTLRGGRTHALTPPRSPKPHVRRPEGASGAVRGPVSRLAAAPARRTYWSLAFRGPARPAAICSRCRLCLLVVGCCVAVARQRACESGAGWLRRRALQLWVAVWSACAAVCAGLRPQNMTHDFCSRQPQSQSACHSARPGHRRAALATRSDALTPPRSG
jgi:hypothetical protein